MIRHHVLFRWSADATEAAIDAVAEGLAELPGKIAAIADYRFGPDLGLAEGNWDFAVTADFATEADYLTYRDDPDHQALIAQRIAPIVAERAAVQVHLD